LTLAVQRWSVTPREVDVLRRIVLGDSNKEIAGRLGCHEGNVERHVTSLLRKCGCESRSRLVARFWTAR
jgi:DNA-binding NarL/FixJ family response regulator